MASTDRKRELRIKAMDMSLEWSKQLITLATGTLVLSATFVKDVFSKNLLWKHIIRDAWVAMMISILCGAALLGSLCALYLKGKTNKLDPYTWPARAFAIGQVMAFSVGLFWLIDFAVRNMRIR